jgi:hypothetical protein
MGNSAASRWTSAPIIVGSGTTPGGLIGEMAHALTSAENGPHTHGVTDPGHIHGFNGPAPPQLQNISVQSGSGATAQNPGAAAVIGNATTGITINSSGSGTAHNTVQRTVLGTFYRKL